MFSGPHSEDNPSLRAWMALRQLVCRGLVGFWLVSRAKAFKKRSATFPQASGKFLVQPSVDFVRAVSGAEVDQQYGFILQTCTLEQGVEAWSLQHFGTMPLLSWAQAICHAKMLFTHDNTVSERGS